MAVTIVEITIVAAEVLKLAANPRLRRRSKIATMLHFVTLPLSHEDEDGAATCCTSDKFFLIMFNNILASCEHLADGKKHCSDGVQSCSCCRRAPNKI